MSRVVFLTYNDAPSGIFRSQIAGVCNFIGEISENEVKLVSFVSIRKFFKTRSLIKKMYPNSLVLPMFPRHKNWRKNRFSLNLFVKNKKNTTIICRGVFTSNLAIKVGGFRKIVYDGRGAFAAEYKEYLQEIDIQDDLLGLEKNAVENSDFRIAVSVKLIEHWNTISSYSGNNHVVIPCTISLEKNSLSSFDQILAVKAKYGFSKNDVVFVYSGSAAGWQSQQLLDKFMKLILVSCEHNRIILMSKFNLEEFESYNLYKKKIQQIWVNPNEVGEILKIADYGLMLREQTVTNKVASPTKFAEYLNAGLKVLCTDNLGDYSNLIKDENLGFILNENLGENKFRNVESAEKIRMKNYAQSNFTKNAYLKEYQKVIE